MTAARPTDGRRRLQPDAVALGVARTLAWAGLVGGWLVLGGLARHQVPAGWLALAPQALWLAVVALTLRAVRDRGDTARGAAVAVAATGIATSLALALAVPGVVPVWRGGPGLWLVAVSWGVWLVAVSRLVRRLRLGLRTTTGRMPPSPAVPAALGGALAWLVAGDATAVAVTPGPAALAVLAATAVLALLAGRTVTLPAGAPPGCRAGLFDCALAWPGRATWRRPRDWPVAAASIAMLPMMGALPWMAEGCVVAGLSPSTTVALHLAAMLVPPVALATLAPAITPDRCRTATAALLVAGAAVVAWRPDPAGLLAAMLLQGMAWGVAIGGAWGVGPRAAAERPRGDSPAVAARHGPGVDGLVPSVLPPLLLLGLGAATGVTGPLAWTPLVMLLGAMGASGLLARAWRPSRASRPEPAASRTTSAR